MIPFLDLAAATSELRDELDEAYRRFMDSGWYVLGEEVAAFEREYADYCEANYCVGVGTGLDAITLALRALDIGPGDEVIVPSNTYIATWLAITNVGATIVPVEPNNQTYNIDSQLLASAITTRTKVILPVNLYGLPVDYDTITEIATESDVKVVIDNAQAHGARYKGRRVGGLADIECHSFYPSKNLGAFGEGGAISTNDAAIADRVRALRNYGSKVRYYNDECGTNSRLDAIQAALLRVKLRHLDDWNDRRRGIAATYISELSDVAELKLPNTRHWSSPAWHLFVVQSDHRDELQSQLLENGIGTQVHYPVPPHLSKAYANQQWRAGDFPIAETFANTVLSIPIGPHLSSSDAVLICNTLRAVCESLQNE